MIGISFDCQENMLYWTDFGRRTINRALLEFGSEPEAIISQGDLSVYLSMSISLSVIMGNYDGCITHVFSPCSPITQCEIPGLVQPEGIAVDTVHRKLFWVDSGKDRIETSGLDGGSRQVLIDSDLVNPRAIVVDAQRGSVRNIIKILHLLSVHHYVFTIMHT